MMVKPMKLVKILGLPIPYKIRLKALWYRTLGYRVQVDDATSESFRSKDSLCFRYADSGTFNIVLTDDRVIIVKT